MYSTVMYIGLHEQYRYVYRSACTVPFCISVCMYSTVMYIGLHVQCRYVYRSACTVPLCISVCMYSTVMYIGPHVQYRYSCPILVKLEFSGQIFEKYTNIKFHKNPSIVSRGIQCGQTDRQTDMTKQVAVFRNFANAPEHRTAQCTDRTNCIVHSTFSSSVPAVHRRPVRWSMSRISPT